ADGKWTIGDLLVVGDQGQGRLTVSDGGVVTGNTQTSNATVGSGAGSQGRVTVDGDGSRWAFQRLTVGDAGNGRVTVTDGGVVDSKRQDVRIATQGGSTGTLRIGDGGRPGELSQGVQVTFGAGDGMLVFGHTDANYSFDSALKSQIAGAGKIEHYAGTTHLTGNSSGFSGDTTVYGGTLAVDGTRGSDDGVAANAKIGRHRTMVGAGD